MSRYFRRYDHITTSDLLSFAEQIASAMEYLSSKNVNKTPYFDMSMKRLRKYTTAFLDFASRRGTEKHFSKVKYDHKVGRFRFIAAVD